MIDVQLHRPVHPVRFVTAAALFDGHDAAINVIRRLLQTQGAEVIHLGHNRSVDEVVDAAVEEDVQGVAISSYQGGHVEYFTYLVERLAQAGRPDVAVYGGGGGVIVPSEIALLESRGVKRIFSPEDGQRLGLAAMVNTLIEECDLDRAAGGPPSWEELVSGSPGALARMLTVLEAGRADAGLRSEIEAGATRGGHRPVLGITGTGGSGKSSLTDELLRRLRLASSGKLRVAALAIDPTRRRGGGALLGDRIRMNAIDGPQTFFRSLATRGSRSEIPEHLPLMVNACQAAGFDLVVVETPGIGQGDAAITEIADLSLYVMTPEYGAATQLEKIDMVELADLIAINKSDRRGAADALRDVRRQWRRAHPEVAPSGRPERESAPVLATIAARFNDAGVTALYQEVAARLDLPELDGPARGAQGGSFDRLAASPGKGRSSTAEAIVPPARVGYLAEVADAVRQYHQDTAQLAAAARQVQQVEATAALVADQGGVAAGELHGMAADLREGLPPEVDGLLEGWETARHRETLTRESLAGTMVPRVALPGFSDRGDLVSWLRRENVPGQFPFTAGVFPYKRQGEDPARMFAGEGDARRTNRRFHLLAQGQPATRLSTAFDSVTLYGFDPTERPDIYGKIGTSGVSIATLDDMKELFEGFDLCDPTTSVSMTINGPAPTILAMFFNTAIDQQIERWADEHGSPPEGAELERVRAEALHKVRGTVQADILKEDQGQNTCIFSTEFSLRAMADVQQWFIDQGVANFYSVSISGYHIAEAGANPITQLAFTLANGLTYVEAYRARGMAIDDFAPSFSFFFSNGMDPEYTVIGRVARRVWAIAMREHYGAGERAQKLKYHIQTSGRSLHAQEMSFNDIRTTLQALCAIYDNANSLHTNAYDEAVTTPTAESVRRALAIQMVINKEWGLAYNENPLQGSFIVDELTDLVEEAVLLELERISERGGVLGAMETGYQRGRIQDDSLYYEQRKHDGSLPIVGVNTFLGTTTTAGDPPELARATEEEKRGQLERLHRFHELHTHQREEALDRLQQAALTGSNLFAELMEAVRHASLGQITEALFEVGGTYRRSV